MNNVGHPGWCSQTRCSITAGPGGAHESEPHRVAGRGRGRPPRFLILLMQRTGQPVRVRIVVIGDHLINSTEVDVDTADLAARTLAGVVALTRPAEPNG